MTFFGDMLFIFVLPGIAAALAISKKLGWYFGTAALVFAVDVTIGAVFIASAKTTGHPEASEAVQALAGWFGMLVTDAIMISIAANSGKKCPACMSRIHPQATRCPKCQANIAPSAKSAEAS